MELRLIIRWPSNRETIPDYPGGPDVHTWALKSSKRKLQGQRKRCKGRRGRRDSECEGDSPVLTDFEVGGMWQQTKKCGGLPETSSWQPAKKLGLQSHNCKEVNYANNLNEQKKRFSPRASRSKCSLADILIFSPVISISDTQSYNNNKCASFETAKFMVVVDTMEN